MSHGRRRVTWVIRQGWGGMGRPGSRAFGVLGIALGTLLWAPPGVEAAPVPLNAHVTGTDGHGRIEAPALSCDDGGDGAYWHYAYSGSLPAGGGHGFSQLPADVRLNIAKYWYVVATDRLARWIAPIEQKLADWIDKPVASW